MVRLLKYIELEDLSFVGSDAVSVSKITDFLKGSLSIYSGSKNSFFADISECVMPVKVKQLY